MIFRLRFLLAASMLVLFPISALAQSNNTPAPTCSIRTTPSTIRFGGSFTLSWTSTNATGGAIIGIGNVAPTGSRNTIPTRTTTYTGSFTGPGGSATCSATVTIDMGQDTAGGTTGASPMIGASPTTDASPMTNAPAIPGGSTSANTNGGSTNVSNNASSGGGSGLVPCSGLNCQACDVAKLIQNLINFLIGLSIPLAAAMFAWAGILYYTSGVAGTKNITKAKAIFKSSALGFLFIICAWLGVQTLLKAVLNPTFYQGWNTIQCVNTASRPMNQNIGTWLNNALGVLNTNAVPVPVTTFNDRYTGDNATNAEVAGVTCPENSQYNGAIKSCVNNETLEVVPFKSTAFTERFNGNSGAGTAQWSQQLQSACVNSGLSDCAFAQAIMANESGGRSGVISPAGAVGLMQVMPGTARGLDPANLSGLSDSEIVQRLKDPDYNMQLGTKYLAQLSDQFKSDPALMAAAYNGGAKANNYSTVCGGGTAWQCTQNSGYAETRKYVPNVLGTYNTLKK